MEPTLKFVNYEADGPVRVIRLNRPERRNALGVEMLADLSAAFRAYEADEEARVAILTAAGSTFCSGKDLKEGGSGLALSESEPNPFLVKRIPSAPPVRRAGFVKPVIAALNGGAAGGGFFMAVLADLIVASTASFLQISEVGLGLPVGWNIGPDFGLSRHAAAELALGQRVSPERALQMGLVCRVVEPEALLDEAMAMAKEIAGRPPRAIEDNLTLLADAYEQGNDELWERATKMREAAQGSHDFREARAAFAEKRPPKFTGR